MKYITIFLLVLTGKNFLIAQTPVIQYQKLAIGLTNPVDIAAPADGSGRLFIVEQNGTVRIWNGSQLLSGVFLNIPNLVTSGGERGLLSLVFHPDYKNNRYFFVYYTRSGDGSITVARYRAVEGNPDLADPASGVILLNIPHPNGNHNGGKLVFGSDGFLYLATGDGGGGNDLANNAQNGRSLLGKMLRIDVNDFADTTPPLYTIPPSNPYTNDENVNDEIIALGLRNPFRWSFDRVTGDVWIGDVGQGTREEVDFHAKASILSPTNYGWRCLEGFITNPAAGIGCPAPANYFPPIFDYGHNSAGGYVITGGYVYRGLEYPALKGYYICTDFATGNIWLIKSDSVGVFIVAPQTVNKVPAISSFGEAENGSLYAVQLSPGTLYKIVTPTVLPLKLISFTGEVRDNLHDIKWIVNNMVPGDLQILERRLPDEIVFKEVAKKTATGNENNIESDILVAAVNNETFYRLKIITHNDTTYSQVLQLNNNPDLLNIFTATISGDYADILLLQQARSIRLLNASGQELYRNNINTPTGVLHIPLTKFARGVIFVIVFTAKTSKVKKLVW